MRTVQARCGGSGVAAITLTQEVSMLRITVGGAPVYENCFGDDVL